MSISFCYDYLCKTVSPVLPFSDPVTAWIQIKIIFVTNCRTWQCMINYKNKIKFIKIKERKSRRTS